MQLSPDRFPSCFLSFSPHSLGFLPRSSPLLLQLGTQPSLRAAFTPPFPVRAGMTRILCLCQGLHLLEEKRPWSPASLLGDCTNIAMVVSQHSPQQGLGASSDLRAEGTFPLLEDTCPAALHKNQNIFLSSGKPIAVSSSTTVLSNRLYLFRVTPLQSPVPSKWVPESLDTTDQVTGTPRTACRKEGGCNKSLLPSGVSWHSTMQDDNKHGCKNCQLPTDAMGTKRGPNCSRWIICCGSVWPVFSPTPESRHPSTV